MEALRAAVVATEECPRSEAAALVRQSYTLQLRRAEEELAQEGADATVETVAAPVAPADGDSSVVHAATGAQRRRLVALRADGTIGDAAFQRLEEELDWTELGWAQVLPPADRKG